MQYIIYYSLLCNMHSNKLWKNVFESDNLLKYIMTFDPTKTAGASILDHSLFKRCNGMYECVLNV